MDLLNGLTVWIWGTGLQASNQAIELRAQFRSLNLNLAYPIHNLGSCLAEMRTKEKPRFASEILEPQWLYASLSTEGLSLSFQACSCSAKSRILPPGDILHPV